MSDSFLCIYPADIFAPKPNWPKLRDALVENGFMVPVDKAESFIPGPRYDDYRSYTSERVRAESITRIRADDHGDAIGVHCGEGTEPPSIPGTDRVVGDWIEFIGQWVDDPTCRWIDPETGKGYSLLELDFDHHLAACRWCLTIENPDYLDEAKVTAMVGDIAGQKFRYALYWI
jgi:hypothetical protein